jgi:hypothetical protein
MHKPLSGARTRRIPPNTLGQTQKMRPVALPWLPPRSDSAFLSVCKRRPVTGILQKIRFLPTSSRRRCGRREPGYPRLRTSQSRHDCCRRTHSMQWELYEGSGNVPFAYSLCNCAKKDAEVQTTKSARRSPHSLAFGPRRRPRRLPMLIQRRPSGPAIRRIHGHHTPRRSASGLQPPPTMLGLWDAVSAVSASDRSRPRHSATAINDQDEARPLCQSAGLGRATLATGGGIGGCHAL